MIEASDKVHVCYNAYYYYYYCYEFTESVVQLHDDKNYKLVKMTSIDHEYTVKLI